MNESEQVLKLATLYGMPEEALAEIILLTETVEEMNFMIVQSCYYSFIVAKAWGKVREPKIEEIEGMIRKYREDDDWLEAFAIDTLLRLKQDNRKRKELH